MQMTAKSKKSREHESAIAVLKAEIARCESAGEYFERSKAEGYTRAVQLLLADRNQANGQSAKAVQENKS